MALALGGGQELLKGFADAALFGSGFLDGSGLGNVLPLAGEQVKAGAAVGGGGPVAQLLVQAVGKGLGGLRVAVVDEHQLRLLFKAPEPGDESVLGR